MIFSKAYLKEHQMDGIRFMWENTVGSIRALKGENFRGSGCILAHCMGLGKVLVIYSVLKLSFLANF